MGTDEHMWATCMHGKTNTMLWWQGATQNAQKQTECIDVKGECHTGMHSTIRQKYTTINEDKMVRYR